MVIAVGVGPDNSVESNFIGLNAAGTAALGNGGNGVNIQDSGDSVLIGGSSAGDGNVISGNSGDGVLADDTAETLTIQGNLIGMNRAGSGPLGNSGNGITLAGPPTTIGGSVAGAGNVLSGNGDDGINITSAGNWVAGNFVGTNAAGLAARGNAQDGVLVSGGATGNTIGGPTAGYRNILSGQTGDAGVAITGVGTTGNLVQGNFIGLDRNGTIAIPNTKRGVALDATRSNAVGTPPRGSVILATRLRSSAAPLRLKRGRISVMKHHR